MTNMHAADGRRRRSSGSSARAPATIAITIVQAFAVPRPRPRHWNTTSSTALETLASTPPTTTAGLTSRWYGRPSPRWWLSRDRSAGLVAVREKRPEAVEDPVDARRVEGEATVDHEVLAGDEPGEVRAQEHHDVRDVLRLTCPAHRRLGDHVVDVVGQRLEHGVGQSGADEARRHRVHPDQRPVLERGAGGHGCDA